MPAGALLLAPAFALGFSYPVFTGMIFGAAALVFFEFVAVAYIIPLCIISCLLLITLLLLFHNLTFLRLYKTVIAQITHHLCHLHTAIF